MKEKLIIKNATILDIDSGYKYEKRNIYIENGKIKKILDKEILIDGAKYFDAEGYIVSPGFIDIHSHLYTATSLGIDADTVGISTGVTTIFDAGSCGPLNIDDFYKKNIINNTTDTYVLLNIAKTGLIKERYEIADLNNIDEELIYETVKKYPNLIKGIKARASASTVGTLGITPIEIAKKIAIKAGLPLMVHIGNYPPKLDDVLNLLDKGDVVTHTYHGKVNGLLNDSKIIQKAIEAKSRGVFWDVGHGTSSFNFNTANKAFNQGFYPDTISTDIYKQNYKYPVKSLADTINKIISLGLSVEECITKVTSNPAKVFNLNNVGAIKIDYKADLTVFKIENKKLIYNDSDGNEITSNMGIKVLYTVKNGEIYELQGVEY
ncbi:amidohydrolase/deacetylase family metallohydrolase [Abyssisolibacter fermentans]|uniref:amidohydrolase/deacetylase family metallohydrolase n=1 Tax=Abyssisolibacter fermentans TaxID=1766203 RepID=UPI00082E53F7|nr:amidohydrolase/deacetylase family metallohydrolase [Abyssisolibacter fermentans]